MPTPGPLAAFDLSERPIGMPMLCHAGSLEAVPDDPKQYASRKEDGWRALCAMTETDGVLRSRNAHRLDQVPYIPRALHALGAPRGTVFDGELVDLARPRIERRTGSILEAARPHTPTAADPAITYAIFDLLFIAGEDLRDLPLHKRLIRLNDLLRWTLPTDGPEGSFPIMLVEHVPSTPEFAQAALDLGKEGIVLKHRDSLYRHGARTDWHRYKPQDTVDAICTAVIYAGGDPGGAVTSLAYELDSGGSGQVASGLTERDRQHIAAHPEEYIGRFLALRHLAVERSGTLRSAVYDGRRHPADKAPTQKTPRKRTAAPKVSAAASKGAGAPRNYKRMGDTKLLAAEVSLAARSGPAYEACMEKHSQNPEGDLAIVRAEIKRRNLR